MTNSQQPNDALTGKLKRTELQHSASSIPGREIVQVLIEVPAGVESGWHMHPGEEVGYILAGTVEIMIQGQPTLTLKAGDGFLMPPRTPHNALDLGPETGPDALDLHRRGRPTVGDLRALTRDGRLTTSIGSPAPMSPSRATRKYAPGRPECAKRFKKPGSPIRTPSLKHGKRGRATSSRVLPTAHRSPITASETGRPRTVRFSPKAP